MTATTASDREIRDAELYLAYLESGKNATAAGNTHGVPRTTIRDAVKRHEARLAAIETAATQAPAAVEDAKPAATETVTTEQAPAEPVQEQQNHKPKASKTAKTVKAELPTGVITPVSFRHLLISEGLAAATLRPQTIYDYVKHSPRNGFPVKHYSMADGTMYDEPQRDADGNTATRPGVTASLARDWYTAKIAAKAVA